jgi:hypothetical protein
LGFGRVLLVQAHEQVDQFAADGGDAEQGRQLGEFDEPLGVPGRPVVIGPFDDPVDAMVNLAGLVQQVGNLIQRGRHLASAFSWLATR